MISLTKRTQIVQIDLGLFDFMENIFFVVRLIQGYP